MIKSESNLAPKLAAAVFIFLAIAIQIQFSFFPSEDYKGLRLNLADLGLPVIGLGIILSLLSKKSQWPEFYIPHTYLWLTGLGLILLAALMNSFFLYGELNHWGLVNKVIGWAVLSAYFLMGSWLARNTPSHYLLLFIKTAIALFVIIALFECIYMLIQSYTPKGTLPKKGLPISGLMANKNAYSFWALTLFTVGFFLRDKIKPGFLIPLMSFLFPLLFYYTNARAGFLAFIVMAILLFIFEKGKTGKTIVIGFFLGLLTTFTIIQTTPTSTLFRGTQFVTAAQIQSIQEKENYSVPDYSTATSHKGDSIRLTVLRTTKNMILENPLFGSGLGSARYAQEKEWGEFVNLIDSTPLWLWAETGLFGMLAFLAFYLLCLKALWRKNHNPAEDLIHKQMAKAVFVILIIFGIMSLFHEILYTRFLWLFMGMALAITSHHENRIQA
jgi:O-antigen ligase